MGSKNRIAKYLKPFLEKNLNGDNYYVEPFVGGANMIDKIEYDKRIGGDFNEYLIEMWKGLQDDLNRPKIISKDLYSEARSYYNNKETTKNFSKFIIGWIGWMGSYNGRFFDGGYSGHSVGKTQRDYISEQIRNTEKQSSNLKDVTFIYSNYNKLHIPKNSVIYCDIPYKDTKQYITSKDFNHEKFWEWCRTKVNEGHFVYVSEYNAPNDFVCIWEKEVTNSMNQSKTYKPTEKLFIHKDQLELCKLN
jgi:DNA adenine methylase